MRLDFLTKPAVERADLIREAALRRGMAVPVMEKDFWVSWILGVLFADSMVGPHIVFKGGTSLSKVAGAIQRFSEDVDLALSPEFADVTSEQIAAADSRTSRVALMAQLQIACADAVRDRVRPSLERAIVEVLGLRANGADWLEYAVDDISRSPVLQFHYPTTTAGGFEYLSRMVKLEFGSLTDQRPTGSHAITPWAAEVFPDAFADWDCKVVALEAERTFWEKATILHGEAHRAADSQTPARYSRHYSDLAALSTGPIAQRAIVQVALRNRVVEWKSQYFARAWARYDLALPGSFKLLPQYARRRELELDYVKMEVMFISPPPPFAEVLARLAQLEIDINAGAIA